MVRGVFIKIEDGINGLIHITELSDTKVGNINDIVKIGDVLDLKVLSISPVERHLGLSLKKAGISNDRDQEIKPKNPKKSTKTKKDKTKKEG